MRALILITSQSGRWAFWVNELAYQQLVREVRIPEPPIFRKESLDEAIVRNKEWGSGRAY
jgi:hypothetical protein